MVMVTVKPMSRPRPHGKVISFYQLRYDNLINANAEEPAKEGANSGDLAAHKPDAWC